MNVNDVMLLLIQYSGALWRYFPFWCNFFVKRACKCRFIGLIVLCETKRNEICTCEMKICTLRNEICTLRNENLSFAK